METAPALDFQPALTASRIPPLPGGAKGGRFRMREPTSPKQTLDKTIGRLFCFNMFASLDGTVQHKAVCAPAKADAVHATVFGQDIALDIYRIIASAAFNKVLAAFALCVQGQGLLPFTRSHADAHFYTLRTKDLYGVVPAFARVQGVGFTPIGLSMHSNCAVRKNGVG